MAMFNSYKYYQRVTWPFQSAPKKLFEKRHPPSPPSPPSPSQFIGLREKIQENPIFHGKIYGFRLRFSLFYQPIDPENGRWGGQSQISGFSVWRWPSQPGKLPLYAPWWIRRWVQMRYTVQTYWGDMWLYVMIPCYIMLYHVISSHIILHHVRL